MIEYTIQKYGQDKVAQIITFGTMGARAAIRDVGRAMDLPLGEVDRVAKLIPFGPKVNIQDGLDNVPELRQMYEKTDYIRQLIDNARSLEGIARHASTHAAGVIVADKPLVEHVPLHRPTKGQGGVVVQFDGEILESIGLLKVDFLGLSTLTIMRIACEHIARRHGVSRAWVSRIVGVLDMAPKEQDLGVPHKQNSPGFLHTRNVDVRPGTR